MKWKENKYIYTLFFIAGSITCYLSLQWTLLDIKKEVDVVGFLTSLGTALIGLYIAHTIQRNINKSQNQHSFIQGKLDAVWTKFNDYSQTICFDDKIPSATYTKFTKDVIHPIEFLKTVFKSFEIDGNCLKELEQKLSVFDAFMLGLRKEENIIYFDDKKTAIEQHIAEAHEKFSKVLSTITER